MTSDPFLWIVAGLMITAALLVVLGRELPLRRQYKYMLGIGGTMFAAGILCAILAVVNYHGLWWLNSCFAALLGSFSIPWLVEGFSSLKTVRRQASKNSQTNSSLE